jgi:hypothetical protein
MTDPTSTKRYTPTLHKYIWEGRHRVQLKHLVVIQYNFIFFTFLSGKNHKYNQVVFISLPPGKTRILSLLDHVMGITQSESSMEKGVWFLFYRTSG